MIVLQNRHGSVKVCPKCGSTLLLQHNDIYAVEDFHNPDIRADCGACGETMYVEKDIPKSWTINAYERAGIE